MRVLAVVRRDMRVAIRHQLGGVGCDVTFIDGASELSALIRAGEVFSVVILPASLPGGEMWAMWGELSLLNPRPEILVYASRANFQIWSGVLEAGGRDVLVEPFSAEELQYAVLDAEKAFEERRTLGIIEEALLKALGETWKIIPRTIG
jgi:DNA-binding NtrC family response regulator